LVLCFWKLEHIAVGACCFLDAVFRVIDSLCIHVYMTEPHFCWCSFSSLWCPSFVISCASGVGRRHVVVVFLCFSCMEQTCALMMIYWSLIQREVYLSEWLFDRASAAQAGIKEWWWYAGRLACSWWLDVAVVGEWGCVFSGSFASLYLW
jgi:hypothetical protein